MRSRKSVSSLLAPSATKSQTAFIIAIVLGCLWVVLGLWALTAPESFYAIVAPFAPYNQHFAHDMGAFQFGLGTALLLALRFGDALLVAFGANIAAGVAHELSHTMDSQLGGHSYDIPNLALLAALPLLGLVLRSFAIARATSTATPAPADRVAKTNAGLSN
jgi:hypothetical protein